MAKQKEKRFSYGIRTKVFLGFALVLLILVLAIVSNIYQINLTKKYSNELQQSAMPATIVTLEISKEVNAATTFLYSWLLTQDEKYIKQFKTSWNKIKVLQLYLDSLAQKWTYHKNIALWTQIQTQLAALSKFEYELINKNIKSAANRPDAQNNITISKEDVSEVHTHIMGKLQELQKLLGSTNITHGMKASGLVYEQQYALEKNTRSFIRNIDILQINQWGMLAAAIVITIIIAFVTARLASDPLRKAIRIAHEVASGRRDLVIHTRRHDEAGMLLNALSDMQSSIKETENKLRESEADVSHLLSQLQDRVRDYRDMLEHVASGDLTKRVKTEGDDVLAELGQFLNKTTEGLSDITKEIATAIFQMSTNIAEVRDAVSVQSEAASAQSAHVKESVKIIDNIKSSSVQMLSGADILLHTAEQTQEKSQKGLEAVAETEEGMRHIRSDVKAIAQSIVALSDRIKKIAEITQAVNTLSERSKLLALNASIEAAKAGESGKGFAVVANEVKELADQSQQATAQVQSILEEIETATSKVVDVSELGTQGVDRGLKLVESAGIVIQDLSQVIIDAEQANKQMVESIKHEVSQIDQIAHAMVEISDAANKLSSSTRQTSKVANEFADIAQQLNKSVRRYKFDGMNPAENNVDE